MYGSYVRCGVGPLRPGCVSGIKRTVVRDAHLESSFCLELRINFVLGCFHDSCRLPLVILNCDTMTHNDTSLCWKAVCTGPGALFLSSELIIILLYIFLDHVGCRSLRADGTLRGSLIKLAFFLAVSALFRHFATFGWFLFFNHLLLSFSIYGFRLWDLNGDVIVFRCEEILHSCHMLNFYTVV